MKYIKQKRNHIFGKNSKKNKNYIENIYINIREKNNIKLKRMYTKTIPSEDTI